MNKCLPLSLLVCLLLWAGVAWGRVVKVDVCHQTAKGRIVLISVDDNAVPAHLRHGDALAQTFYVDQDEDGYGNPEVTTEDCGLPEGFVTDNTDCDDSDPLIYPGPLEVCANGKDDNCDGATDEPFPDGSGCGQVGGD